MKLTGIIPALVTPFYQDNKTINQEAARKLIDLQLAQGAGGFYVLGGTGEGIAMAREEREIMCETAVQHVAGRKPVVIHIAAMVFHEAVALAKHAEKAGADAIAAIPPCFFYYSDEEIYQYYRKLAQSVSIPLIIYYHPRAQQSMSAELIARIFEIDNVTGVKWSSYDYYEMMRLKEMTNGEINLLIGDDEMLVAGLAAGGDAGVGSTFNILLPEFNKIYYYVQEGKQEKALELQMKVNRIITLMIRYELVPAVKQAIKFMGIDVGDAIFPYKSFSEQEAAEFAEELKKLSWPYVGLEKVVK